MPDIRIPTSPIHGLVGTAGDATHGPFIQLEVGASKVVYIYELRVSCTIASGTSRLRMRRTTSGSKLTLGGTTTVGQLDRRDQRDVTAFTSTLKGCTAVVGTLFTEAVSFWYELLPSAGTNGSQETELIKPDSYPLILTAGSVLEFANPDASATNLLRLFAVFDEFAA